MRAILCKSLIDRLKPAEKPYEVRDTRTSGLLVRVQPSGVMTYYLQLGRGRRIKIGPITISIEDAREVATGHIAAIAKGKDPVRIQIETGGHTFLSFIEKEYAPCATTYRKTAPQLIHRLKTNFKTFHRKRLAQITAEHFEKWRTQRLNQGKSRQTVNSDLDDINAVLSKAVLWGYLRSNPLKQIQKLKTDRMRALRYLSDAEDRRLFEELGARELRVRQARERTNSWRLVRSYPFLPTLHNQVYADYLRPMVILALNTGMRRTEVFGLCWKDIDLDRKFLTVRGENTKSLQTRYIPLNKVGLKCLSDWQAQCADNDGLVFPAKAGTRLTSVNAAWHGVLAKAEILGFRWHDLRHTFASRLVMKGRKVS